MRGIRELRKTLVRGALVRVLDTYPNGDLHGCMYVKSKGLTPCRQRPGQCAEDRKCNGHAVFVCDVDPAQSGSGAGWRDGTTKICLSFLGDGHGTAFTDERKSRGRPTKGVVERRKAPAPTFALPPEPEDPTVPVTWVELANVAAAATTGQVDGVETLVRLARRLKSRESAITAKLIEAQERLISVQDRALRELTGVEPGAALMVEEFDPGETEEDAELLAAIEAGTAEPVAVVPVQTFANIAALERGFDQD